MRILNRCRRSINLNRLRSNYRITALLRQADIHRVSSLIHREEIPVTVGLAEILPEEQGRVVAVRAHFIHLVIIEAHTPVLPVFQKKRSVLKQRRNADGKAGIEILNLLGHKRSAEREKAM